MCINFNTHYMRSMLQAFVTNIKLQISGARELQDDVVRELMSNIQMHFHSLSQMGLL